jgi:YfiH family protein
VSAAVAAAPAFLQPRWDVPPSVRAAFSLRAGGVSSGRYAALNLGSHVGDQSAAVAENRRRLRQALALAQEPLWLSQQHGTAVVDADRIALEDGRAPLADAAFTRQPGRVLAVLVADCIPVLLADAAGRAVAVAHAGWRGLCAGVIEAALGALAIDPMHVRAWIGPGITRAHFEVGEEVRAAFCAADGRAESAFERNARGRWQCDLFGLVEQRLLRAGVTRIAGERRCTYAEPASFYSFRRDGVTGRMAALVWIEPGNAAAPPETAA